ncbi:MAG: class II glutamine amidotransferase [Actinophytocola sp.]|uniref:class II glutamine amidotransferase n=1 Tax=Actinophytocola sp. TaxID=1872138 RepID=UPI003D6A84D9
MCLLTFFPAGVMPDTAALRNGTYLNDDGHGYAIVADDHILTGRGLDAGLMIEAFDAARHQHPHGPALFHSRLGTHGKRSLDNCHPFPVGGDERTVLAHNGILPAVVQPTKGDPRSDTRITAEDFLPEFGSLRARRTRLRFQRWMAPHNKVVILTVDRRFKQPAYILNEKSGTWDGEIWYSNDGYLPFAPTRGSLAYRRGWEWPSWDELDQAVDRCWHCHAIVDPLDGECRCCGLCLDCGETPETCLCYTPATTGKRIDPAGV